MKEKVLFLSGLNGLRSIAAISVMISHIALAINDFNIKIYLFGSSTTGNPNSWGLGSHGVTIFFVLSGFLITYLLLLESKKTEIHIKKFYIRRILRIWPIYYLYLFICIIIAIIIGKTSNFNAIPFYLLFAANIPFVFEFCLPFLDHFWSIGVEEQFYLFWPWIIKKIKKNLMPFLVLLVVILNIIRYFLWWKFPFSEGAIFSIVNRFDSMMIGGIGAILFETKNQLFIKFVDAKITQLIAWSAILFVAFNFKFVNAIVDTTIITFVSLILIVGQINKKNRLINLDIPILNFIGKISYGIYVYHIVIIFLFSLLFKDLMINEVVKIIIVYVSIVVATVIIAYISYEYFEKRFIKMKDRFAIIKSSSSSN
jgi:peptidoglycan/LPS O-acetylase OafA/YrhL